MTDFDVNRISDMSQRLHSTSQTELQVEQVLGGSVNNGVDGGGEGVVVVVEVEIGPTVVLCVSGRIIFSVQGGSSAGSASQIIVGSAAEQEISKLELEFHKEQPSPLHLHYGTMEENSPVRFP